jgi:hypothetical protein
VDWLGLPHSIETFLRDWTHVMLQLPPQSLVAEPVGSTFHTFFDTPRANRLALVRGVGETVTKVVGPHLQSIYSMDVTDVDDTNRTLKVSIEAREQARRADVLWTFDLGFPKGGFLRKPPPAKPKRAKGKARTKAR